MGNLTPLPSSDFRRFICLYNPIYLLSSVCMLGSCVLLANDSVHSHVPIGQLLGLVGTLAVYQAALFAIGAFLILSRSILRDGRTLLILDAIFLSDITFVNSELITTQLSTGLAIGLMLLAFTALRVHWISRRMGCFMPLHRYLLILMQVGLIVLIPSYLKHIDNGKSVTPVVFYAMWWIIGLMVGGGVVIDTILQRMARATHLAPKAAWVQPTYLIAPWISLVLHLSVLHYVYNTTFYAAMLVPVLLSMAMLLKRMEERHPVVFRNTTAPQVICLALAFFLGIGAPDGLYLKMGFGNPIEISAVKLTFAGLYGAIVYMYFRKQANWFALTGVAIAFLVAFGPSFEQICHAIAVSVRWMIKAVVMILPETRTGWGIVGIVASFALLGLGTWISLRKPPEGDHHEPAMLPPAPEPEVVPEISVTHEQTAAEG